MRLRPKTGSAGKYLVGLICIATVLVFPSCNEGIIEGEGYVFDAKTNQPLDSVLVKSYIRNKKKKHYNMEMTTDTTGYFRGSAGLVGCVPDCPDLIIELTKEGYITKEIINLYKDTVYLETQ